MSNGQQWTALIGLSVAGGALFVEFPLAGIGLVIAGIAFRLTTHGG